MPRVKRGVTARKKHKKVLQRTEGHYGARHRLIKTARESMMHALRYSYRDRRTRKRDMRSLWIQRINAGAHLYGLNYNQLIRGLTLAHVEVDRKVMADLAATDLPAFGALVKTAQTALAAQPQPAQPQPAQPQPAQPQPAQPQPAQPQAKA